LLFAVPPFLGDICAPLFFDNAKLCARFSGTRKAGSAGRLLLHLSACGCRSLVQG